MILTILITIWITCSIVYVAKELARPFSSSRSFLIILDLIFGPYLLISDIIQEWRQNKEWRDKYKK